MLTLVMKGTVLITDVLIPAATFFILWLSWYILWKPKYHELNLIREAIRLKQTDPLGKRIFIGAFVVLVILNCAYFNARLEGAL